MSHFCPGATKTAYINKTDGDYYIYFYLQVWKKKTQESEDNLVEVLIAEDLTHLTLDVIGLTAFGYNFDTVKSGENEISEAFDSILSGRLSLSSRFLRKFIPFYQYLPFEANVKAKRAKELTDSLVWEVRWSLFELLCGKKIYFALFRKTS